jgi:putative transposase
MHVDFFILALQKAITKYGAPEGMRSDQGSLLTSLENVTLKTYNIAISMDSKVCWRDNVFKSGCGRASNMRRLILRTPSAHHKSGSRLANT